MSTLFLSQCIKWPWEQFISCAVLVYFKIPWGMTLLWSKVDIWELCLKDWMKIVMEKYVSSVNTLVNTSGWPLIEQSSPSTEKNKVLVEIGDSSLVLVSIKAFTKDPPLHAIPYPTLEKIWFCWSHSWHFLTGCCYTFPNSYM